MVKQLFSDSLTLGHVLTVSQSCVIMSDDGVDMNNNHIFQLWEFSVVDKSEA